jgi:hypothetical protein
MMGQLNHDQEQFFYSFRLAEAVPEDHLVREIAAVLDLSWPGETFGSLGTQLLLERIAGKAGRRSRRIVLQTDLFVRESCCVNSGLPTRN